ncbi:MAG: LptF/LptG family permease [Parvibaculales bacterium]
MPRYSLYITRQLLGPILLITVMLGGMGWIIQAVRLLELLGGQTDSVLTYFGLTLLTLPRILAMVIPIALFCGTLYGLNKMTQDSELLVLSATGISRWQLTFPALGIAAIVTAVVLACTLWLSPLSLQKLRDHRHAVQNDLARTLIKDGAFHNPAKKLTVHSRYRGEDGTYHGLLLHDARQADSIVTYVAREGAIIYSDDTPKMLLIDGSIHTPSDNGPTNILRFKEYVYDMSAIAPPAGKIVYEIKERYIQDLLHPELNRGYDKVFANKLIATGHNHLAETLHAFAYVLICFATILTSTMSRLGQNKRLLIGGGIALSFKLTSFGILGLASNNNDYIWAMYAVSMLTCIAAAGWLHFAPDRNTFSAVKAKFGLSRVSEEIG